MINKKYSHELLIIANQKVKERDYWLEKMSGDPPKTFFPYDNGAGANGNEPVYTRKEFNLPPQLVSRLRAVSRGSDQALHIILLTALAVLLHRYTGGNDIITAAPIYKQKIETGYINTVLPLRTRLNRQTTFKELLLRMKQTLEEAVENQNYPIEILLEQLNLAREDNGFPLTDVAILHSNIHDKKYLEPIRPNMIFSIREKHGTMETEVEYNRNLYAEGTIKRVFNHLIVLQEQVLEHMDTPVSIIDILSARQKKQLLEEFNDTAFAYPKESTIPGLFAEQVEKGPDHTALVGPGATRGLASLPTPMFITFRELNKKSNQLACIMKNKGVGPDVIAALMVEPSLEMIIGILAILKAGGAFLPIAPGYTPERIQYMLKDSKAGVLVTTRKLQAKVKAEVEENAGLPPGLLLQLINIETDFEASFNSSFSTLTSTCQVSPANLAYVIYTSGTTGKPKGVLITHGNLVNYTSWFTNFARISAQDHAIVTSSFTFDAIYTQVFSSLLQGGELHVIPREVYLNGQQLLDYLCWHRITYIKVTPSLFSIIVNSPDFSQRMFQSFRFVMLGGEAINVTDVEKARRVCPSLPFMNHYGPTETTIGSTALFIDFETFEDYKQRPAIGKPIGNTRVYILDRYFNLLPVGAAGELCIAGQGLARGYLNRPELTAEKFDHDLWDLQDYHDEKKTNLLIKNYKLQNTNYKQIPNHKLQITNKTAMQSCNHAAIQYHSPSLHHPITPLPHSPIYRTGDLAQWQPDGNILYLGRTDNQVKIRGYRVELAEIENHLMKLDMIKSALVVCRRQDTNQEKYLCAYIVFADQVEKAPGLSEIREHLSNLLPAYMIPSFFVPLEKIPLTPHGKIDQKALPEPVLALVHKHAAPGDEVEKKLQEIWVGVLGLEKKMISINDNFFELGGHSLKATLMIVNIHKEFAVKLPLIEVFKNATIKELAQTIKKAANNQSVSIKPAEEKEYYPLSSAQTRIYFHEQMEKSNLSYHMFSVVELEGNLDRQKFQETFKKMITRHESLRTSFEVQNQEPVQRIHKNVKFQVDYFEMSEEAARQKVNDLIQSFEIDKPPLFKSVLLRLGADKYLLIYNMHHIISDGVSYSIFLREFIDLYRGENLPAPRHRYKDYSEWQRQFVSGAIKNQERYWLKEFQTKAPQLTMPVDYPGSRKRSFKGDWVEYEMNRELTQKVKQLVLKTETTLFILLLAVYNVLLSKYTRQTDIVVGTPVSARTHPDLSSLIGMMVNMLALRNFPLQQKTFRSFLKEVKNNAFNGFENQDYPFEELIKKLAVNRSHGGNPLFSTVFALNNFDAPTADFIEMKIPGLKIKPYPYDIKTSHFDLVLHANEINDTIRISLEYSTEMYKESSARKLLERYVEIIQQVLEDDHITIENINVSHGLLMSETDVLQDSDSNFGF